MKIPSAYSNSLYGKAVGAFKKDDKTKDIPVVPAKPDAPKQDQIVLSRRGEMDRLTQRISGDVSGKRAGDARIEQLRNDIKSGAYKPSPADIAQAMLAGAFMGEA